MCSEIRRNRAIKIGISPGAPACPPDKPPGEFSPKSAALVCQARYLTLPVAQI